MQGIWYTGAEWWSPQETHTKDQIARLRRTALKCTSSGWTGQHAMNDTYTRQLVSTIVISAQHHLISEAMGIIVRH